MTVEPEDRRDGFAFRGGHLGLDLAATLAGRRKPAQRELLSTPRDLSRWLRASGLAQTLPATSDRDLVEARRLREAIYVLALARAREAPLPARARADLNRFAARPAASAQLDAKSEMKLTGSARNVLASVAQDVVRLLSSAHPVRQCEGEDCAILFVDASRAGDRRWCSMSACGNRAKVADFRRRKREVQ